MKYKLVIIIYMTLLCSSVATGGTRLQESAEKLVSQYLAALIQGNTDLLLGSIGGDLLEGRRTLLNNPGYSSYLAEVYAGATASVTGSRQLTGNRVAVDAMIRKTTDEQSGYIFLVEVMKGKEKKLLIIAEQDAETQDR